LVGYLAVLYRDRRRINWALFGVLLLAAGFIWGQTLLRGVSSLYGVLLLPAARYALPVVVLTVFPFTAGWLAIARCLDRRSSVSLKASLAVYFLFLAGLNVLAVYNIYRVYHAA
jgi:hypothetical protein